MNLITGVRHPRIYVQLHSRRKKIWSTESVAKAGYYPTPPSVVVERVPAALCPATHSSRQVMRLLIRAVVRRRAPANRRCRRRRDVWR